MANFFDYHASDIIQLKLSDFEGPLDLLYTLIVKENKMDIATCPISSVTQQYLAYMDQIGTVDMDVASDFLVIAATLLDIKARSLLPKPEEDDLGEEDEYDPEEELRRQLMIFQMFKEEADEIRKQEVLNQFYNEPKYTDDDAEIVVKSFDFNKLIEAYGKVLLKISQKDKEIGIKKIRKDKFTVTEKIALISLVVKEKKRIKFADLFGDDASRTEVITTFQALLELMKKQFVKATQDTFESDIYIELNEEEEGGKELDLQKLTQTEDKYDEE